jgi:putative ABC transport system permease protein
MTMGAFTRGLRNPGRNLARSALVVGLLSVIIGLFGIMVQAAALTRQQLGQLEARVRTLIELREAGAFGTGGFGGDQPVGEEAFSIATLEKVRAIPHARHLVRLDEYVYTPQIDPSKPNAYAMLIGLRPGAELRAIGEVDYEHAQLIAGRNLQAEDGDQPVAVIGRLYARQRANLKPPLDDGTLANASILLNGTPFRVVGVYATGNDFGDNHVFIPLDVFRQTFQPGEKLSKIFVTVDSVQHVETVVEELKAIPEADVVTAPEAVSTAKTTLAAIAATSLYGALVVFVAGGVLVAFAMVLSTRERVREIGVLKAIAAANSELVGQFVAEALTLTLAAGVGALGVGVLAQSVLQRTLGLTLRLDGTLFLLILGSALIFASLGSLYPIVHGIRVSPVEAMREE